ncbi:50S ribosomal protein L25/general stress protein Ctc [Flavobacteriaceae bacterium]|nr:50S ribosomal protein L25/general stress protein Ctc [Flavobacteriaceae bacterium]MDA9846475.1 50S ribosomal protein L25/general stress protein Ctc [Flavobacteriaceae bacterium]MDC3301068.1 50S ribosomal protein L25/general stress protein Ctc [Flavobacteriaceae bacterium]MDG2484906.1 50S ribosomal protein L25/general stress protein Ctc [Flavobacteriaceae bacterium]
MKSITINGSKRESVGKKATKALRNAGQVPCVLYGGDQPVHFSAAELAFSKLVYTPNAHTVVIALGETTFNAVLQDIQFHPVTENILHIDFYQLFDDKEIAMDIPVVLTGNSVGVRAGGVLRRNRRKLRIKALPTNLPDNIVVDISKLKIGNKVYVSELENDGFKFLHTDNTVVCQIKQSRVSVDIEDDEDEEGAEGAEGAAAEGGAEGAATTEA